MPTSEQLKGVERIKHGDEARVVDLFRSASGGYIRMFYKYAAMFYDAFDSVTCAFQKQCMSSKIKIRHKKCASVVYSSEIHCTQAKNM